MPIVVVTIAHLRDVEVLRELLTAHTFWHLRGLKVDLVLISEEIPSYDEPLTDHLRRLAEGALEPQDLPRNRFTARLGPQRDDARSVAPESSRGDTGDGKGGALISYFQAIVIGLLQGVTELFPISSLGHSVLIPSWLGWDHVVSAQSAGESFYLAFVVALHVATALALLVYFREEWNRIIRGFLRTLRTRRLETPDERMAWLLIVATIPTGLIGLAFEHTLRTLFAKPLAAAILLTINGAILLAGERVRRRGAVRALVAEHPTARSEGEEGRRLDTLEFREAAAVGVAQIGALFAGISRSGITMVAGLVRGLDHEDAARFSFLLATPIILAAGIYKVPDLAGHLGDGIRGQALVGSIFAGLAAYGSVRFLMRFFETRSLLPFAIYCLIFGALSIVRFA
jgi:undecaprenyl-diphosphatase